MFARDILRLGTAMIELLLDEGVAAQVPAATGLPSGYPVASDGYKMAATLTALTTGRLAALDALPSVPANLPVG
ncbi:hypothetical protein MBRA_25690 [Mycobacterium branderi]|uniref:Uncharacterized protein n=1 Tax=Mycobacterium branderi TaxID=43348 RepID=A0ABM7KMU3_9MYCO|nr:hypothetical protein MBRA_25690 [Mycobacterium branderi]